MWSPHLRGWSRGRGPGLGAQCRGSTRRRAGLAPADVYQPTAGWPCTCMGDPQDSRFTPGPIALPAPTGGPLRLPSAGTPFNAAPRLLLTLLP